MYITVEYVHHNNINLQNALDKDYETGTYVYQRLRNQPYVIHINRYQDLLIYSMPAHNNMPGVNDVVFGLTKASHAVPLQYNHWFTHIANHYLLAWQAFMYGAHAKRTVRHQRHL